MKLTPLADNVLLKSFEAEEKTASGIILSTATKEKSVVSEVVAAGPGTDDVKMTVKKGDKVIIHVSEAASSCLLHRVIEAIRNAE